MSSIFDGVDYLYAERLKGKRVTLTIKEVVSDVEFFCMQSNKKEKGFDVVFEEKAHGSDKPMKLGVTSTTVKRQLFMACGTDEIKDMAGKKITIYPVKSAKSATGQAIRIAVPEFAA